MQDDNYGVDLNESRRREELEGIEGEEIIFRIYYMGKISYFQ